MLTPRTPSCLATNVAEGRRAAQQPTEHGDMEYDTRISDLTHLRAPALCLCCCRRPPAMNSCCCGREPRVSGRSEAVRSCGSDRRPTAVAAAGSVVTGGWVIPQVTRAGAPGKGWRTWLPSDLGRVTQNVATSDVSKAIQRGCVVGWPVGAGGVQATDRVEPETLAVGKRRAPSATTGGDGL